MKRYSSKITEILLSIFTSQMSNNLDKWSQFYLLGCPKYNINYTYHGTNEGLTEFMKTSGSFSGNRLENVRSWPLWPYTYKQLTLTTWTHTDLQLIIAFINLSQILPTGCPNDLNCFPKTFLSIQIIDCTCFKNLDISMILTWWKYFFLPPS